MKQTAVEWFQEQIIDIVNGRCELSEIEIFNKAKEMEKEQIIEAFDMGLITENIYYGYDDKKASQYYNETYNQDKE